MTRRQRWIGFATAMGLAVALMLGLSLFSRPSSRAGLQEGDLRPCPETPNCVCSCDTDDEHGIAPLNAGEKPDLTMERLHQLLESRPRVEVISFDGQYLHAEFTSRWLRYVDDVEFLLDRTAGMIAVRSASRVGHSDLGVNRRRVEELRRDLAAAAGDN